MYACICHAVTEDAVNAAVDAGCHTVDEIGEATKAGTGCGSCHHRLEDILDARCGACPRLRLVVA